MTMTAQVIDLFSGQGGFSLAAHWMGWETILFCEKEPFPQSVLRANFPGVPIFDDVCKLTSEQIEKTGKEKLGSRWRTDAIVLVGGFP